MLREEVLKTVTHTGDCFRIKTKHDPEPFNFYVSKILNTGIEQDCSAPEIPYKFVSFQSIESVEAY